MRTSKATERLVVVLAFEEVQLLDVAGPVQAFASANEIALKAELAADLPACSMDRDLVAGALENLLQNAFEATPRATTPATVTVRTALARARQTEGVLLSVEDTGHGMSARTRERALDDFFTTKATGMGMGLSISRSIIRTHGGRLWVEPNEGGGACFVFTLPPGEVTP